MGIYGTTIDVRSRLFRPLTVDERILAQAVLLRLSTRRGTYWTAPDYGLLLSDYILLGLTPEQLARIPLEVQHQLELDERIESVTVTATRAATAGKVRLFLTILIQPSQGPSFSLVIAADALTVELLTKGAA